MTRKEKIIALLSKGEPMLPDELAAAIKLPEKSRGKFADLLAELMSEGLIISYKRGRLTTPGQAGLIRAVLRTNPKGFGFAVRSDGCGDDIYVSSDNFGGAINGDAVLVKMLPPRSGKRPECAVRKVLSHEVTRIVGTLRLYAGIGIVKPDDEKLPREIFVSSKGKKGGDGQKVVVRITEYLSDGSLRGVIEEILGYPDDFGVDVLSIIKGYNFNIEFPKKVLAEANAIPDSISEADLADRLDLRDETLITIDGADSKDLDDAVSLKRLDGGYRLGVHIADVSAYVRMGSPLDKEALSRGTSVYLVDRVIPMLPPRLSNGICSLNEGEDRLAVSVLMDMDEQGNILKSNFCKSVIKSAHRMTYTDVWAILNGDGALAERYADIADMLGDMYALSLELKKRAAERGYIELDLPEARAVLDGSGKAVGIELRRINGANELIEQFMVSANMEVAKFLWERNVPAIYRVHGEPSGERLDMLRRFVGTLGYNTQSGLQALVKSAEGTPEAPIISAMLLRSMAKAAYSPSNTGHYGLGAENYCHFTSPIRRYPDLVCHRALKAAIEGDEAAMRKIRRSNAEAADSSSEREVAAERCERDTLDMKKAEYMEQFVGREFVGTISAVTSFGFFVALENTVEGLVPINSLVDDYYVFDEAALALRGERLHREYRVGDEAVVILAGASKERRRIDFVLKEMMSAKKAAAEKKQKEAAKKNGTGKRSKNSRSKQKRIPRVFHRRKNRGRH